jgi:hypothetical protein
MIGRTTAVLALAGAASAFSPMMSMETGRRQVVQAGAAAAVAAPLLKANPAAAKYDQSGRAPVIVIFDHRGCNRGGPNAEYTGPQSGDQDDEMCVKVSNPIIPTRSNQAFSQLRESISFTGKGIDGDFTSCVKNGFCDMPGKSSGRGGA